MRLGIMAIYNKPATQLIITFISFALLLLLLYYCPSRSLVVGPWHLNDSYTLAPPTFTQEAATGPWNLEHYGRGSLAYLIFGRNFSDVSVYLCLLSSPTPSSSAQLSFTLSIYMYSNAAIYGGAIVWTANGLHPAISGSSISLHLLPDGNLVLLGNGRLNIPIWSSNTSHKGVTTMDVTRNPASLVLRNASGHIVWQSADYPTDTLTTAQFLRPGHRLTSWKSPTDPSPGVYALVMEPSGLALYINGASLQDPQSYWIWSYYGRNDSFSIKHTCEQTLLGAFVNPSGALDLSTDFPGSPVDTGESHWPPFCHLQPDIAESRLPFKQYKMGESVSQLSNLTFLHLEHDGNLRAYSLGSSPWSTQFDLFHSDACLLPSHCGSYGICTNPGAQCKCPVKEPSMYPLDPSDFSRGCSPQGPETDCRDPSVTDQFWTLRIWKLDGVDYTANIYTPSLSSIPTMDACKDECEQNCSCKVAFWRRDTNACHHLDGTVQSFHGGLDSNDYTAYLKVMVYNLQEPNSKTTVIVVVSTAVFVIVLVLVLWRRSHSQEATSDDEEDPLFEGLPTRFSYKDLLQITNGFQRELGKGGFGAVYAGQLVDGTQVAVKRLELGLGQGNNEFRAEVAIMGGISHHNLLRLRGFCAQKGHRLLVYEYMPNGSLDQWLFSDQAPRKSQLTWKVRCKIALGIAQGLAYLHHGTRQKVIHLDVKPQNILLDEDFEAKVADFGLSRLLKKSETHVMTAMRGTPGYLAPDWLKEGPIDEKCDVFSFGMLLMEIVSGRRNLEYKAEGKVYYPEWAFWQAQKEDVTPLTDAALGSYNAEEEKVQLRRLINTAFLCVLEDPTMRPTMANVVHMLQGLVPRVQEIQLSSLHQGLFFVLRSPSSFAKERMDETLRGLMQRSMSRDGVRASSFSVSGAYVSSFSVLSAR